MRQANITMAALFHTLYGELVDTRPATLPPALLELYGSDLDFPDQVSEARPYVYANFVETLDGVVSFMLPGQSGGGEISGRDKPDRFIMGLLRAAADAVLVGAGTLRDTPGHVWSPERIYPAARDHYAEFREQLGKTGKAPLQVFLSARGELDPQHAAFHTIGSATLILTTPVGKERLQAEGGLPPPVEVQAIGEGASLSFPDILRLLRQRNIRWLLTEGGPQVIGGLLQAGCLDELFLTLAPQLAGRARPPATPRPGFVEGLAFTPETAQWMTLLSVKQAKSLLYLRYQNRAKT